jgi:hypothetical protein
MKMWKRELIRNKIVALLFVVIGVIPVIFFRDGTALVLCLLFAVPLFVAKKNYILSDSDIQSEHAVTQIRNQRKGERHEK